MLADNQSKEITRLRDELQSQTSNNKRKNSFNNMNNLSSEYENQILNLQKQFEIETEKFQEKFHLYEETEATMTEVIKDKGKDHNFNIIKNIR